MRRYCIVAFLGLSLFVGVARADAIVTVRAMTATTIAEYFIEKDGVRAELEIGFGDISAFRNLLPDALYEKLGNEPRPIAERWREFFRNDLPIAPIAGVPIKGRVITLELRDRILRDEITGEPLPTGNDPEKVVFAELFYPFQTRPESLILSGPPGPSGASIGFVAYHEGVAINDFRYLGRDYVLDLDWDDPWYSRFRVRSLRRTYEAPMTGFIYVEPFEVRKEIIVRPRDLQRWIDLGLAGTEPIAADAQPELTRRIGAFLRDRHKVLIDGEAIEPELARINFLRRTLKNSTVVDPPEELDPYSATVGVIFVYPTDGLPDRVTMEWDLFDDRIDRVPVSAVDQAGPLPSFLTPEDPLLVWQNFLTNPKLPELVVTETPPTRLARTAHRARWVALALLLATTLYAIHSFRRRRAVSPSVTIATVIGLLLTVGTFWAARDAGWSDPRKRQLVGDLLHNVYRAFDFRDEEKIYDVLARSVAGDLLTDIYLETRRGLEVRNQGGARAKVKELELVELEVEPGNNGGFVAQAQWDVSGSVGHWGHIHSRSNRYRAALGIEPVDGSWKLTSLELLEESRLPGSTGVSP